MRGPGCRPPLTDDCGQVISLGLSVSQPGRGVLRSRFLISHDSRAISYIGSPSIVVVTRGGHPIALIGGKVPIAPVEVPGGP